MRRRPRRLSALGAFGINTRGLDSSLCDGFFVGRRLPETLKYWRMPMHWRLSDGWLPAGSAATRCLVYESQGCICCSLWTRRSCEVDHNASCYRLDPDLT